MIPCIDTGNMVSITMRGVVKMICCKGSSSMFHTAKSRVVSTTCCRWCSNMQNVAGFGVITTTPCTYLHVTNRVIKMTPFGSTRDMATFSLRECSENEWSHCNNSIQFQWWHLPCTQNTSTSVNTGTRLEHGWNHIQTFQQNIQNLTPVKF